MIIVVGNTACKHVNRVLVVVVAIRVGVYLSCRNASAGHRQQQQQASHLPY